MKKLLIIGASVLQLPAIKKAKDLGYYVAVADYDPKAVGIPFADEYFNVSTIDVEGVTDVAKKFDPAGIITLATDMPMRSIAAAAKECGLPGISMETAIKSTDKGEMIKTFEQNLVEHPWYYIVNNENDFFAVCNKVSFPCIMKPTDSSGSRGVMLLENLEELKTAYNYTKSFSRGGAVIIEEYLNGPEVSVEIVAFNGKVNVLQITDKLTTGAPHFVEMGHSQPSRLPNDDKEKIIDLACRAVKSVGIENGPAHVEIILTENGPKMVELGARMGGDCITTHLVPLSTGIDMIKATIDIACGNIPDILPKFGKASAIRYFDVPNGTITEISGVEKAKEIAGVVEVTFVKQIGDKVGRIGSSTDRVGFVIAEADTSENAVQICEKAINNINISVEKTLLILGGFPQMIDIVFTAKEMGVKTIVVDKDENSPAKKFADKTFNISTNEIEKLVELCKNENIDGVFTGFEDFNIHIACELCEILNLPFYATKSQLECITNKILFKEKCKEYGIPIIEQYSKNQAAILGKYPYIIKPADSYGSRGITVCRNAKELEEGYLKAKKVSKTATVIIERFVDYDYGTELFYTIVNGEIYLTATADRYTVKNGETTVPLPVAEVFPSRQRNKMVNELDANLRRMFRGLNIKNGLILIQSLFDGNDFFVYEMAFRFTGEQHYRLVSKQQGVNLAKMMIKLSLGEDISEYQTEKLKDEYFVFPSVNLVLILNSGKIKCVSGLEKVYKIDEVVSYNLTHFNNDIIKASGDYSHMLIRINMVAKNYENLKTAVKKVDDFVTVTSDAGEDMLATHFSIPKEG